MEAYVGHIGIFHATLVNSASTSKDHNERIRNRSRMVEIDHKLLKSILNWMQSMGTERGKIAIREDDGINPIVHRIIENHVLVHLPWSTELL